MVFWYRGGGSDYSTTLNNAVLYMDRTYYVTFVYRGRGDGNSSPSKTSNVGFIAYWDNWADSRTVGNRDYAKEYARIGDVIVETGSFTVPKEPITPGSTRIYTICNFAWANGTDNQNVDCFYAKYWDSLGFVYDERRNLGSNLISKWLDGTAITTEKSVSSTGVWTGSSSTETYIWSEVIADGVLVEGETYTIDFYAKTNDNVASVEVFFYSTDYQTTGFITSKAYLPVPTSKNWTHYKHTFVYKKQSSTSTVPNLRIRFDNNGVKTAGTTGILYIKDVKLRKGVLEQPRFLKATDSKGIPYYAQLNDITGNLLVKDKTSNYGYLPSPPPNDY